MKTGNTISRTSTNSIHKTLNGRTVWFHQDSIHNIKDLSKYGKRILYYVMKQIVNGKRELPIPFEYQDKDFSIHFTVKEDKTLVFDYDLVPKEFRPPQPQHTAKEIVKNGEEITSPAIGMRMEWHGEDLWEITSVYKHKPDSKYSPFYVQAKNVKKDGTLGKQMLSYFTDRPTQANISVQRTEPRQSISSQAFIPQHTQGEPLVMNLTNKWIAKHPNFLVLTIGDELLALVPYKGNEEKILKAQEKKADLIIEAWNTLEQNKKKQAVHDAMIQTLSILKRELILEVEKGKQQAKGKDWTNHITAIDALLKTAQEI